MAIRKINNRYYKYRTTRRGKKVSNEYMGKASLLDRIKEYLASLWKNKKAHSGIRGRAKAELRHYYRHKALGLCTKCSKKAKTGFTMCDYHLEDQRRRYYIWKEKRDNGRK